MSELILYQTGHHSIWDTQREIAKPSATNKRDASVHAANFLKQNGLDQNLLVRDFFITSADNDVADVEDFQTLTAIGQQAKRRGNGK
jgi:membrane-bound lytic murein transglycosylase B